MTVENIETAALESTDLQITRTPIEVERIRTIV